MVSIPALKINFEKAFVDNLNKVINESNKLPTFSIRCRLRCAATHINDVTAIIPLDESSSSTT